MNENLCIAIITTASIFAGFLVAFLSSYLTLDEDGNVKSFMHAIDALHRDLKLKQYKQNPYIDYSEEDLDRIKIFVNSIWYNLIHKNYQEVHFSQLLDCPMGISPGYFTTIRKEL